MDGASPLPGARFDDVTRAGRGGSSVVYRAHDRLLARTVAVKVLERDAPDGAYARCEIEVLTRLRHPGIVAYFDDGVTDDGFPFVVTEWLDGETLEARLRRGPFTERAAVALVAAIADALGHAHVRGVVHRDVKPSNVFLVRGDARLPKLIDFGIALMPYAAFGGEWRGVVGTPGYLAPEQARAEPAGTQADVFALGAVLFECVAGRPLFGRGSAGVVLARQMLDAVPRLRSVVPCASAALDELLASMLATAPEDRPRDARAVVQRLASLGELPDRLPAAPPAPAGSERGAACAGRCVIVAGDPGAAPRAARDSRTMRTVRDEDAPPSTTVADAAAHATLERHGFRVVQGQRRPLLGVRPLGDDGASIAREAARCAVALRALAPELAVVIAAGDDATDARGEGDLIARSLARFRAARAGVIAIDDDVARWIDGTFETAGEPGARRLERDPSAGPRPGGGVR